MLLLSMKCTFQAYRAHFEDDPTGTTWLSHNKIVYTTFNYVVLTKSDYSQYVAVTITYKHISVNCFER